MGEDEVVRFETRQPKLVVRAEIGYKTNLKRQHLEFHKRNYDGSIGIKTAAACSDKRNPDETKQ